MKTARFSDAQIMGILKQAEGGTPVSELCRVHGMSSASFYKWRAKFGGMDALVGGHRKQLLHHASMKPLKRPRVLTDNGGAAWQEISKRSQVKAGGGGRCKICRHRSNPCSQKRRTPSHALAII